MISCESLAQHEECCLNLAIADWCASIFSRCSVVRVAIVSFSTQSGVTRIDRERQISWMARTRSYSSWVAVLTPIVPSFNACFRAFWLSLTTLTVCSWSLVMDTVVSTCCRMISEAKMPYNLALYWLPGHHWGSLSLRPSALACRVPNWMCNCPFPVCYRLGN